jgi:RimJ/RimL family protein N-acetyltransferase
VGFRPRYLSDVTSPTVLETERLNLRRYELEDLDALEEILGDPETMRFYPHPYERDDCRAWIQNNLGRYESDGFGLFVIEDKASGEFLGNCGPAKRVVEGVEDVELGWHVKRSRWRQGIATEAALACRDHAFDELGLERLISIILPVNIPSQGVAKKIGMTVEREALYKGFPSLIYSMTRPR